MFNKIFKSKNYLFIFKIIVTEEQVIKYAAAAEERRKRILSLLGYKDGCMEKKAVYIVDMSENENMQSGQGNSQCIHLYINSINEIMQDCNLVIHEETHFLLFNLYPQISVFLNEGIAEFICWEYTKKDIPQDFMDNFRYIKEISRDIILSNDNWLKYYSQRGIWIYGIAYLFVKCTLGSKFTVRELLDSVYINNQTELINQGLKACIIMNEGKNG